jgi:hypothetical protein
MRPEVPVELQPIPAANGLRQKVEFIRDVLREWIANDGIGNSDFSRAGRLRWSGMRQVSVNVPNKHVWCTVGARQGDERASCYVDEENRMGEDLEDSAKTGPSRTREG